MILKVIEENGKLRPKCATCNAFASRFEEDPYECEINGNCDAVYMCEECFSNSCDEI